ncbi:hypothetical protein [Tsukamurella pseudospumae]|uniref:DUF7832 domain-containing protein n=1 Tax=Tsukamurella pseudospumae TaxID=239498 RepID=A0A138AW15_9ACTN|nr:hypothetical protein [Tsukamurella pseudospumae]KXO89569.1 hypothetical protein AXK61_09065 [Tsukamurella pseudospumae]KXP14624.1 hypothetical protein AXK60_01650 [Tsukamurella pseudospumae]
MTYDDAEWHQETVDELGLPEDNAATHIGIFYAWMRAHDLASGTTLWHGVPEPVPDPHLDLLDDRKLTPGAYLVQHMVGQFDSGAFTDEGNAFTDASYSAYLDAYSTVPEVAGYDSTYAAPDTWQLYDAVAPTIDALYARWKSGVAR